jgi:hypothetical protein
LGPTYDVVTGTFDGGKLIALDKWVGTNTTAGYTNIDAHADVPDQTPGVLDISGLQHWRCAGVFRVPSYAPSTGGLFPSDQDRQRDKALSLPQMGGGFAGPPGSYRVTIEVPSVSAKFSHTWTFLGPPYPPTTYNISNPSACLPIAETLELQRSIADQYLSGLQALLNQVVPTAIRTQLQAMLDRAKQAKISGDGQADQDLRAATYRLAIGHLTAMAQLAGDATPVLDGRRWVPLSDLDVRNIKKFATNAAAVLSQTALS